MAAAEQRDVAVDDRVCRLEPKLERSFDLLVLLFLRDARERLDGLGAIGVAALHAMGATGAARFVLVAVALLSSGHSQVLASANRDLSAS